MKKSPLFWLGTVLVLSLFLGGTAVLAADAAKKPMPLPSPAPAAMPQGMKTEGDIITLHNLTIDKKKKEIRMSVATAIDSGVLEYLLVGEVGKTYESVFKIADTKPSEFNFALLLLGFSPMDFEEYRKATQASGSLASLAAKHPDSLLSVTIEAGGKAVDLFSLVQDRQDEKAPLVWVFTGGYFLDDGRYAPDWIWNFAAIWPDPASVLNLFSDRDNPYRSNGGFVMNETNKKLKIDQPFTLVVRRYKP